MMVGVTLQYYYWCYGLSDRERVCVRARGPMGRRFMEMEERRAWSRGHWAIDLPPPTE